MTKTACAALALFCLSLPAMAQQLAPTPRAAPRTPVNREALAERNAVIAREINGPAQALDGDKLRIAGADLRLFGIVAPQLSANQGPQARAMLDTLTASQNIDCRIRDRDHDGRLLATCHNAAGADLAQELLRRGLAVSARGSLGDTDLATPYLAAEQSAQSQKLGLWTVAAPAPAPAAAAPLAATPGPVTSTSLIEAVKSEMARVEAKTEPVSVTPPPIVAPPVVTVTPTAAPAVIAPPVATPLNAQTVDLHRDDKTVKLPATATAALVAPVAEDKTMPPLNFFARYQILIAGGLMLLTACGILLVFAIQRRNDKRDETRAIAAALRGELMAMRAVCQTRIKLIRDDIDDRATTWPKLRATLYQAYVGRLGFLGAELARQIASIYGQASDYAAYYSALDETRALTTPKRQALQMLSTYIEEVLPRLAMTEQTGLRPHSFTVPTQSFMPEATRTRIVTPEIANKALTHRPSAASAAAAARATVTREQPQPSAPPPRQQIAAAATQAQATDPDLDHPSHAAPRDDDHFIPRAAATETEILPPATPAATTYVAGAPAKLWESLRHFARAQFGEKPAAPQDDPYGDYASLIEQDIANLSYGEDDPTYPEPKRSNGAR